jgi:hypothetical protein
MKAAWYEKQGAARDVLVVGNMDDPQPSAGEVRIRIAFSGVNPGDVKKREDHLVSGCPIRVSFRTAMVRAPLMRSVKECRVNGSVGVSGVMALNPIDRSELRLSSPRFR